MRKIFNVCALCMTALIFCACPEDTNQYTITTLVSSECIGMGTVTGGGTFKEGQSTIIQALANSGYQFVKWDDGNTEATRTIVVTQNKTYTACFAADQPSSTSLIGKWMDSYGYYYEFVSENRGYFYEPADDQWEKEQYEAFIYKYTQSTGKITLLFDTEYAGAVLKDNAIVHDGNVNTKVSSGPYSANIIGQWTASSGKYLSFCNFSQGKYRQAKGQYVDFTYTYNASSGTITLVINGQTSTATYNGSVVKYDGETYSLGTIPEHDEILGIWINGDYRDVVLYFKTQTYGYFSAKGESYADFNYTFAPNTGVITLYLESGSTETAFYKGDYILYKGNKYNLY